MISGEQPFWIRQFFDDIVFVIQNLPPECHSVNTFDTELTTASTSSETISPCTKATLLFSALSPCSLLKMDAENRKKMCILDP